MELDIHRNNKFILIGCAQTCLGMQRVMPNSESASFQKWVDLWFFFSHAVRHPLNLQIYSIISSECGQVWAKWLRTNCQLYLKNEVWSWFIGIWVGILKYIFSSFILWSGPHNSDPPFNGAGSRVGGAGGSKF